MRDQALDIVAARPSGTDGLNLLREYVQSRTLGQMQEAGAFVPLAFMGGTALRFLFRVPRFSEDLDFTLERDAERFDFRGLVGRIGRGLEREGYGLSVKVSDSKVVAKALIGFPGLLADAGLSAHPDEVLWVKLEVDTNPPAGAGLAVTTVNRFGLLRLQHHDLSSLFAGKLAAVLAREYAKGRDLYDLMWYLSHDPPVEPNVELLRSALLQVAPEQAEGAGSDWSAAVRARLDSVDWADVRRDVAPFLEQSRDLELLAPETFAGLLGAGREPAG
ncbi:MAG: nucleotidyl transferase AbiEii/AbiGii toxin family protein [Coriobacteriales bacterium]|nr:nucleotidyl transferase AbiEii/AbiGii toxin family protein [Coriobacteriales bacterium]